VREADAFFEMDAAAVRPAMPERRDHGGEIRARERLTSIDPQAAG
jgi:hypothetical protein